MEFNLDFEKPIITLEKRLQDLRELAKQEGVDFGSEVRILEKKVASLIDETYSGLSPWQRVQLSRHPARPYSQDYLEILFPDFMELHGDRNFGDDQALIGGVATWPPTPPPGAKPAKTPKTTEPTERFSVLILAQQKGRNTKQKMERNFGMAKPEGYRKAIRLIRLAERSRMPILTFIDTPGAYPGLDAEERGQSQAIAECIEALFEVSVPVVATVIGEGGSGGALAIGIADRILMQEYSVYSVISPESCASILWSDATLAEKAADKLKILPNDLKKLGVIDGIIPEPKGGAHRNLFESAHFLRAALIKNLEDLMKTRGSSPQKRGKRSNEQLKDSRIEKFRVMGNFSISSASRTSLRTDALDDSSETKGSSDTSESPS
jgi:acetyl-CoA carboxylase carboxyl transferase subunit alpha